MPEQDRQAAWGWWAAATETLADSLRRLAGTCPDGKRLAIANARTLEIPGNEPSPRPEIPKPTDFAGHSHQRCGFRIEGLNDANTEASRTRGAISGYGGGTQTLDATRRTGNTSGIGAIIQPYL